MLTTIIAPVNSGKTFTLIHQMLQHTDKKHLILSGEMRPLDLEKYIDHVMNFLRIDRSEHKEFKIDIKDEYHFENEKQLSEYFNSYDMVWIHFCFGLVKFEDSEKESAVDEVERIEEILFNLSKEKDITFVKQVPPIPFFQSEDFFTTLQNEVRENFRVINCKKEGKEIVYFDHLNKQGFRIPLPQ